MATKLVLIDWGALWEAFNAWLEVKNRAAICPKCHHNSYNETEWPDQRDKIEILVNNQLRGKWSNS